MRNIKMADAMKLTKDEIHQKIVDLKRESLDLRVQLATGNLEDTARIKSVKKEIAILKTALNQKARDEQKEAKKDLKEA